MQQLIRLGVGLGNFGILVGLGVVYHGFCLLLGGFHRFESLHNLLSGRLRVLNPHINEGQADVIVLQNFRHQILYLHLDALLAGGQGIVHGGGAHHVSHLALDQIFQNLLRIVGAVKISHRVGNLVFHEEIHIDDVVVWEL